MRVPPGCDVLPACRFVRHAEEEVTESPTKSPVKRPLNERLLEYAYATYTSHSETAAYIDQRLTTISSRASALLTHISIMIGVLVLFVSFARSSGSGKVFVITYVAELTLYIANAIVCLFAVGREWLPDKVSRDFQPEKMFTDRENAESRSRSASKVIIKRYAQAWAFRHRLLLFAYVVVILQTLALIPIVIADFYHSWGSN